MSGCGVNDSATLIERYVICKQSWHLNRQKRVLKFHALEVAALVSGKDFRFFDIGFSLQRSDAIRCQQQLAFFCSNDRILKIRMKRTPALVRNGQGVGGQDK